MPLLRSSVEVQETQPDLFKQIGKLLENQKKKQDDSDELLFSPFSNVTPTTTTNKTFEIFPKNSQFSQKAEQPSQQTAQPGNILPPADQLFGPANRKSDVSQPTKLKVKPNLSLISTDIESDNISNGFNNSGKLDHYSPHTDSGRVASEVTIFPKNLILLEF